MQILIWCFHAETKRCHSERTDDSITNCKYSTATDTRSIVFSRHMKSILLQHVLIDCLQWDTAGQEKFRKITFGLYRGAHGIVLAYDITKKATLDNLDKWLKDITDYGGEKVTKIVAGNKTVRVTHVALVLVLTALYLGLGDRESGDH